MLRRARVDAVTVRRAARYVSATPAWTAPARKPLSWQRSDRRVHRGLLAIKRPKGLAKDGRGRIV